MRSIWKILGIIGLHSIPVLSCAQVTTVNGIRYWTQPDDARLVFDVSANTVHNVYTLQNPPRLVVDFKSAKLHHRFSQPGANNTFFSHIDSGVFNEDNLRVVLELKKDILFKDFSLPPNKSYGTRVVVDLIANTPDTAAQMSKPEPARTAKIESPKTAPTVNAVMASSNASTVVNKTSVNQAESSKGAGKISGNQNLAKSAENTSQPENSNRTKSQAASEEITKPVAYQFKSNREFVVAIDAGHGGEDPGAHGSSGTEEKRVVLAIARKLQAMLDSHPGIRPVMVRDGDYYIKLRKRIDIARAAKADLFISIHADAFKDSSVRGASVFTLSSHGASSEAARLLADSENAADLIGGVSLDDKDDMLASVLLDLSQTATTEASSEVAKKVLVNFKQVNSLHKTAVQKAGFAVLKSPDIPSILVETAFISNPSEEAKLRSEVHQEQMATAIFKGILAYFKQNAPTVAPTMRVAKRANANSKAVTRHAVIAGETLAGIAQHYGITTQELKSANAMEGRNVKPGQLLRIPANT